MRHAVSPCFRFQVTSPGFPHPASQLPQQQHCQHGKRQHARRRFDNGKKMERRRQFTVLRGRQKPRQSGKNLPDNPIPPKQRVAAAAVFSIWPEGAFPPTAGRSDGNRYSRTARDKPCRRPSDGTDKTACPLPPSYPNRFADKRCLNCTAAYRAKSGRLKNGSVRTAYKTATTNKRRW